MPGYQTYPQAIADAVGTGIDVMELPFEWADVELRPYEFDPSAIALRKELFTQHGSLRFVVSLNPLDHVRNMVPEDLRGKPFDDLELIRRYNAFADWVLAAFPELEIDAIAVGNEVDAVLGGRETSWKQYRSFLKAARANIKRSRPDVPVGVKITYGSFLTRRALVDQLVDESDIALLTYYPLEPDGRVRAIERLRGEIEALVAAYDLPIFLAEVGYPASATLGSSEELQARFVREMFAIWDDHPEITGMNFTWTNDIHPQALRTTTDPMGGAEAGLIEFFRTLGLRSAHGRAKPAFVAFEEEAKARGWTPN